jgi:lipopolysaccharide export system protein LptA
MRMTLLTPIAALLALAAAAPAAAQSAQPAQSSNLPIDITADELEVQNSQCISIWRGSAEALQDKSRLRADVLTAHFQPKGAAQPAAGSSANCGDLVSLEAKGAVYYVRGPDQRVRGDAAFYDATKDTITMTGDVIAVQGQNVLRGTRMVINNKTGEGQMQGQNTGRNKAGRVRGVFYPSKSSDGQSK